MHRKGIGHKLYNIIDTNFKDHNVQNASFQYSHPLRVSLQAVLSHLSNNNFAVNKFCAIRYFWKLRYQDTHTRVH